MSLPLWVAVLAWIYGAGVGYFLFHAVSRRNFRLSNIAAIVLWPFVIGFFLVAVKMEWIKLNI